MNLYYYFYFSLSRNIFINFLPLEFLIILTPDDYKKTLINVENGRGKLYDNFYPRSVFFIFSFVKRMSLMVFCTFKIVIKMSSHFFVDHKDIGNIYVYGKFISLLIYFRIKCDFFC